MIIEFLPDYVLKIDFRCHLAYRSAACWTHRKGEIIIMARRFSSVLLARCDLRSSFPGPPDQIPIDDGSPGFEIIEAREDADPAGPRAL